ncbi:MAG: lipid-A-disaccharide synthase [Halothiobacillaceae bacterium]
MNRVQNDAPPTVMFSAGEASGDRYAAEIWLRVSARKPQMTAFGLGGPTSRQAGIETLVDAREIAVMGLVEVLRHYPRLRRAMNTLKSALEERRPALLICIDYQEFNQRLARHARALGIPVLFFVAPQVWAWRPRRAAKMRTVADRLAVLFDFEVPLFDAHGIDTVHVGHPLLDLVDLQRGRDAARQALDLPLRGTVVGLLPGSRLSEIGRLLPPMLESARLLQASHPDCRFVLPRAAGITSQDLAPFLESSPIRSLQVVEGQAHEVMRAADALLVASGTASLEAGIIGTPMVIVYRTHGLTAWLAGRLLETPHVGLPNIIAGQEIVPELLQDQATPERMAGRISSLIDDPELARRQREQLIRLRSRLGDRGALDRLAEQVLSMLRG